MFNMKGKHHASFLFLWCSNRQGLLIKEDVYLVQSSEGSKSKVIAHAFCYSLPDGNIWQSKLPHLKPDNNELDQARFALSITF